MLDLTPEPPEATELDPAPNLESIPPAQGKRTPKVRQPAGAPNSKALKPRKPRKDSKPTLYDFHGPKQKPYDLLDYQIAGVDNFKQLASEPLSPESQEGLIGLATGLGKTLLAAHCIKDVVLDGKKVLWIAHRDELLNQVAKTLWEQVDLKCSREQGQKYKYRPGQGQDNPGGGEVVIASAATLAKAGRLEEFLERFKPDYIFFDEAHHALTPGNMELKRRSPQAKYINLTATAYRDDVRHMLDLGRDLAIMSTAEGIRRGRLAPIKPAGKIVWQSSRKLKVDPKTGDYHIDSIAKVMRSQKMVDTCADIIAKEGPGRRGLVYAVNKQHGDQVYEALKARHLRVARVYGNTPHDEREKIYEQLRAGELDQVVSVHVLTEGFDCPAVDMITILRPTCNAALWAQMLGRGLRVDDPNRPTGKKDCLLLDMFDKTKSKGQAKGLEKPYEKEAIKFRSLSGKPVSLASMFVDWFYRKSDIEEHIAGTRDLADVRHLSNANELYQALYPHDKTIDPVKLAELEPLWDMTKLPPDDLDGYRLLGRKSCCRTPEMLAKVLRDQGYSYHPHGQLPNSIKEFTPQTYGEEDDIAESYDYTAFLDDNRDLENMAIDLVAGKLTLQQQLELASTAFPHKDHFSKRTRDLHWIPRPGENYHFISRIDDKGPYKGDHRFLVRLANGENHEVILNPKGVKKARRNPHVYVEGLSWVPNGYPEENLYIVPSYAASSGWRTQEHSPKQAYWLKSILQQIVQGVDQSDINKAKISKALAHSIITRHSCRNLLPMLDREVRKIIPGAGPKPTPTQPPVSQPTLL